MSKFKIGDKVIIKKGCKVILNGRPSPIPSPLKKAIKDKAVQIIVDVADDGEYANHIYIINFPDTLSIYRFGAEELEKVKITNWRKRIK